MKEISNIPRSYGFSLVELSIVLVILGLLAAGVTAGRDLIRSSELRAVTTELNAFQTALNTFRGKYFAIAGDMTNATDFWGLAGGTTAANNAACITTTPTGTATCNGDGDSTILSSGTEASEVSHFWKQLSNAGLIEGSYTGIDPNVGTDSDHIDQWPGVNSPASRMGQGAGWGIVSYNALSTDTAYFMGNYGLALFFGTQTDFNGPPNTPALTPEEAWGIDKKVDDGKPGRGKVVGVHYASSNCTDTVLGANDDPTATDLDSVYSIDTSTIACALVFRNLY